MQKPFTSKDFKLFTMTHVPGKNKQKKQQKNSHVETYASMYVYLYTQKICNNIYILVHEIHSNVLIRLILTMFTYCQHIY